MPVYQWECDDCDADFEVDSSIEKRDAQATCKLCGSKKIKRLPGSAGFILRGTCWSRDNYARHLGDTPAWRSQQKK